jgi:hypothetical protein
MLCWLATVPRPARYALLALALALAGCKQPSERSEPKAQKPVKPFVEMKDPAIKDYIVRDVAGSLEGGSWRWTFDRPELQFYLKNTANLRLEVGFAIAGATLKDTGPVTVSFFVNGKPLGSMKCAKATDYKFTKAVPVDWLKADEATVVAVEARPLWQAPDGQHLGFILTQAGFLPQGQS